MTRKLSSTARLVTTTTKNVCYAGDTLEGKDGGKYTLDSWDSTGVYVVPQFGLKNRLHVSFGFFHLKVTA
jgi:long-subunit fatty acid transport protein